jgi:stress response protein YsnF
MTVASENVSNLNSTDKQAQIISLLTNLNKKIRNFAVVDKELEQIGAVKDVIIDSNRQISFIISDAQTTPRLFILKGQHVQKIDPQLRKVFLIIDSTQVNNLPEYQERNMEMNTDAQGLSSDGYVADSHIADATSEIHTQQTTLQSEDVIKLLEERLVVDRTKRKIGEIIVRKEIETRMVTIPVRRERLIVEQLSPEHKQLANIDLGEELSQVESNQEIPLANNFEGSLTVTGEFSSPKVASLLLNAIALERNHGCQRIQVTIAVDNEQLQQKYEEWFARTSIGNRQDNGNGK